MRAYNFLQSLCQKYVESKNKKLLWMLKGCLWMRSFHNINSIGSALLFSSNNLKCALQNLPRARASPFIENRILGFLSLGCMVSEDLEQI